VRERGLCHVGEPTERVHDAPHRTEQADIGADRYAKLYQKKLDEYQVKKLEKEKK
jgi:hypothetical protein